MVECGMDIGTFRRIRFIKHHENRCCINPAACNFRGTDCEDAAMRFLTGLAAINVQLRRDLFFDNDHFDVCLRQVWNHVRRRLSSVDYRGTATSDSLPLARAALGAISKNNDGEAHSLCELFESSEECGIACRRVMAEAIGVQPTDFALID